MITVTAHRAGSANAANAAIEWLAPSEPSAPITTRTGPSPSGARCTTSTGHGEPCSTELLTLPSTTESSQLSFPLPTTTRSRSSVEAACTISLASSPSSTRASTCSKPAARNASVGSVGRQTGSGVPLFGREVAGQLSLAHRDVEVVHRHHHDVGRAHGRRAVPASRRRAPTAPLRRWRTGPSSFDSPRSSLDRGTSTGSA